MEDVLTERQETQGSETLNLENQVSSDQMNVPTSDNEDKRNSAENIQPLTETYQSEPVLQHSENSDTNQLLAEPVVADQLNSNESKLDSPLSENGDKQPPDVIQSEPVLQEPNDGDQRLEDNQSETAAQLDTEKNEDFDGQSTGTSEELTVQAIEALQIIDDSFTPHTGGLSLMSENNTTVDHDGGDDSSFEVAKQPHISQEHDKGLGPTSEPDDMVTEEIGDDCTIKVDTTVDEGNQGASSLQDISKDLTQTVTDVENIEPGASGLQEFNQEAAKGQSSDSELSESSVLQDTQVNARETDNLRMRSLGSDGSSSVNGDNGMDQSYIPLGQGYSGEGQGHFVESQGLPEEEQAYVQGLGSSIGTEASDIGRLQENLENILTESSLDQSYDKLPETKQTDNLVCSEELSADVISKDADHVENNQEVKAASQSNELDDYDSDTVEGDTDTSQFAQLIVQHVLGHAVNNFDEHESDSSQQDTLDGGSVASLPMEKVVSTAENIQVTEPVEFSRVANQQDFVAFEPIQQVSQGAGKTSPELSSSSVLLCLDDSRELEDNAQQTIEISLDSEMENETFDFSAGTSVNVSRAESSKSVDENRTGSKPKDDTPQTERHCGFEKLAPLPAYPDFPENYGNYKVCRDIGCGTKECLILETGEHVQCNRGTKVNFLAEDQTTFVPKYASAIPNGQTQTTEPVASPRNQKPVSQVSSKTESALSPRNERSRSPHTSLTNSDNTETPQKKTFRISKTPTKNDCYTVHGTEHLPEANSVPISALSQHSVNGYVPRVEETGRDSGTVGPNYYEAYQNSISSRNQDHERKPLESVTSYDHAYGTSYSSPSSKLKRQLPERPINANSGIFKEAVPRNIESSFSSAETRIDPRILQSSRGYIPGEVSLRQASTSHSQPEQMVRGSSHVQRPGHPMSDNQEAPVRDRYPFERNAVPQKDVKSTNNTDIYHRTPLTVPDMERYEPNLSDPAVYVRYQRNLISANQMISTNDLDNTYAQLQSANIIDHSSAQLPSTSGTYNVPTSPRQHDDQLHRLQMLSRQHDIFSRPQIPGYAGNPPEERFAAPAVISRNSSSEQNDSINLSDLQQADPTKVNDLSESEKAFLSYIYNTYNGPQHGGYEGQRSVSVNANQSRNGLHSTDDVTTSAETSGSIPAFNTLQEQQETWMGMFQTLEEKHQQELKSQYRQHRDTIFDMQQKMEEELFQQQQDLKRKLRAHKSMLDENSSFNSSRSVDVSETANPSHRPSTRQEAKSSQNSSGARNREHSPSWQEIYQEEREKLEDISAINDTTGPLGTAPVRRSLDFDITLDQSTVTANNTRIASPSRSPRSPAANMSQSSRTPPRLNLGQRSRGQISSRSPTGRHSPSRSKSPIERDSVGRKKSPRCHLDEQPTSRRSTLRSQGQVDEHGESASDGLPRSGVYSSPMPILRNNMTKSNEVPVPVQCVTPPRTNDNQPRVITPSLSEIRHSSVLQRELEARHKDLVQQQQDMDQELLGRDVLSDDVHLSSSTRISLREKHAKHMADLREYYEKELQEMRRSLLSSDRNGEISKDSLQHILSENQDYQLENRLLREKVKNIEEKLDTTNRKVRDQEQKLLGMEVRASEYAEYYKEAQEKIASFRNMVEDLQFNNGEKDDLIEQLQGDSSSNKEALKRARKVQEEQAHCIHQDRTALHKLTEKQAERDRECNILRESVSNLEKLLYDARTENVELKRTITRLELENKRISRENDNLHHKHVNTLSLQNSFNESFNQKEVPQTSPRQLPSRQERPSSLEQEVRHSPLRQEVRQSSFRQEVRQSPLRQEVKSSPMRPESRQIPSRQEMRKPHLDTTASKGLFTTTNDQPTRQQHITNESKAEYQQADLTSPVVRAEEELYRLRDMMRNVVASPGQQPSQPKIQKKKFYGSDHVNSRSPSGSPARPDNSHTVKKSYSNSPKMSKSPKSLKSSSENNTQTATKYKANALKKSKRSQISQTPVCSEDTVIQARLESKINNLQEGSYSRQQPEGQPQKNGVDWVPVRKVTDDRNLATRNSSASGREEAKKKKKVTRGRRSRSRSPCRRRKLSANRGRYHGVTVSAEPVMTVDDTLERVRAGNYVTRPEWEDHYTTLTKPKNVESSPRQPTTKADEVKSRLRSIGDMEHRYDDLNLEKRKLESALSRIPSHGKSRKEQERIEDNLDVVEKELASVRMSLKRHNVLKSTI